jgi:hypothetical protein
MNSPLSRRQILGTAAAVAIALPLRALAAPSTPSYDVVVYGGVPGGVAAAVAAARSGAKTLLIEQTKHVGGLSTSGVNTSEIEHMLEPTYGGIAMEFYRRVGKHYGFDLPQYRWESHVAEQIFVDMLKESGVEVWYDLTIDSAKVEGGAIKSISFIDSDKLASAKVFIDATYEGDLMAAAKVSCTFGREPIKQYDEPLAGIRLRDKDIEASPYDDEGRLLPGFTPMEALKEGEGDKKVMNYNFRLTVSKGPDRVPFPEPSRPVNDRRYIALGRLLKSRPQTTLKDLIDLYPFPSGKYEPDGKGRIRPVPTNKWELNNKQNAIISLGHFGGQFEYPDASPVKRKVIVQDHRDYTLGFFQFLKNDASVPLALKQEVAKWGLSAEEFKDNNNWPYYLYVREARRMIGRYVMKQKDVQTDRKKEDAIALGSHWMDCHHVQRVAVSKTAFRNEGRIWEVTKEPFQIPYRILTPSEKECGNLLVPVAVSASHVAFCTLRLESTWMIMGHAAGAAAAIAAAENRSVQNVDVAKLQDALRKQKQAIDL